MSPHQPIHSALLTALSHDYTHLTVIHPTTRALLGYLSIPRLQAQLQSKTVTEQDAVESAMQKFRRKGTKYSIITPSTPLEDLEDFFEGSISGEKQPFAVVTDEGRKFVIGVATREDLDEFVRRRPR